MKPRTLALLILAACSIAAASAQTRNSEMEGPLSGEELLNEWSAHGFVELHRTQLFAFDQALAILNGRYYLMPGVTFDPPTFPVDLSKAQTAEADGLVATTYIQIDAVVSEILDTIAMDQLARKDTGNSARFPFYATYRYQRFIDSQLDFGEGDYKNLYADREQPGRLYTPLSNWGYFGAGLRGSFLFSEDLFLAGLGAVKATKTLGKYGMPWDNDLTAGNSPRGSVFAQMGFEYGTAGQYIHDYFDRALFAPPGIQSTFRTQHDLIRYLRQGALYYASSDEEFRRRYNVLATRIQDAALTDARARALLEMMQKEKHDAEVRKKNEEDKLKQEYPGGPPPPDPYTSPAGPSICVACYGTGPYISPISPPQIQPYQPVVPSLPNYWQFPSPYSPGPGDSGEGDGQEQPGVPVPIPDGQEQPGVPVPIPD